MRFYVYTWAYPNGVVFYMGKGQGDRMYEHESEALNGGTSLKCMIIRHILSCGEKPIITKAYETDNEQDALLYEWILINLVYKPANLANVVQGSMHFEDIEPVQIGKNGMKRYRGVRYCIGLCIEPFKETPRRVVNIHCNTSRFPNFREIYQEILILEHIQ